MIQKLFSPLKGVVAFLCFPLLCFDQISTTVQHDPRIVCVNALRAWLGRAGKNGDNSLSTVVTAYFWSLLSHVCRALLAYGIFTAYVSDKSSTLSRLHVSRQVPILSYVHDATRVVRITILSKMPPLLY